MLARAAANGAQAAFDELVQAHLRLVFAIASEHARYGVVGEDLVSEGVLGLVEATRRFDESRGTRLAVYAAWWIRQRIRRHTIENRRIVRPPSTRQGRKLLSNLRKVQRELVAADGAEPSTEAVAEALGVTAWEVEEMEGVLSGHDVAWSTCDDGMGVAGLYEARISPESEVAAKELDQANRRDIARAIRVLSPRERRIMELRFLGDEMASLASIGKDLCLSRERARQVANRAADKMREAIAQARDAGPALAPAAPPECG